MPAANAHDLARAERAVGGVLLGTAVTAVFATSRGWHLAIPSWVLAGAALATMLPIQRLAPNQFAQSCSNLEIAQTLSIEGGTVETHVASLLRRLQPRDRTQAAVAA